VELKGFRSPTPEEPAPGDDKLSWPAPNGPALPFPPPPGAIPGSSEWPVRDDGHGGGPRPPGYWWPGEQAQRAGTSTGKQPGVLRRAWQRFAAGAAALGAFLAKFGALLLKVKYLSLVLSMFVSVLAYTLLWGWSFAIGFVALMFIHEMGHVVELRRQGIRASLPMFIPFLGAFVNMREMPRSAYQEALSGLAGPYFGTAASVVVAFWGNATGSNFLMQLAAIGFLLNLFNLLPMLPLDGGRAVAALHPAIWFLGLLAVLAFAIYFEAPIAFLILLLGGLELWRRWTRRNSPSSLAYHSLSARQRLTAGCLYVTVVAVAVAGFQLSYVARSVRF